MHPSSSLRQVPQHVFHLFLRHGPLLFLLKTKHAKIKAPQRDSYRIQHDHKAPDVVLVTEPIPVGPTVTKVIVGVSLVHPTGIALLC